MNNMHLMIMAMCSVGLCAVTLADEPAPRPSSQMLWYDSPARNWELEALPIGNGRLGAIIFGGTEKEIIQFNENRPWLGSVRVGLKTESERQVRVRLTGNVTPTLFDKAFACKPGAWQLASGGVVAPATQANCALEITSQQAGTYWLGAISVTPADAFHGRRRQDSTSFCGRGLSGQIILDSSAIT